MGTCISMLADRGHTHLILVAVAVVARPNRNDPVLVAENLYLAPATTVAVVLVSAEALVSF